MTVREALLRAESRLAARGIDSPRLDADLLAASVLGVSRTWLAAHPAAVLDPEQQDALAALLRRRERREPLPYLLERREFLDLCLRVTPAVLIPRPETETLVEEVARRLPPGARVLDVGTGSGCIALGLARLRPDSTVLGIDVDTAAVSVARENSGRTGLAERVTFQTISFPDEIRDLSRPFDAVVSNPPYIPCEMMATLPPEVGLYEPRRALAGGPDGLRLHEALLRESPALLTASGFLAVEVMAGQSVPVCSLAGRIGGWPVVEVLPDLAGIDRVVIWRRERVS